MEKRYFGSFSLQHTIRTVKEHFPECQVVFKNDDTEKSVTFRFSPDDRKKYSLSEGVRTYSFLNGHLILSNGCMDPFKYDKLDELIESTELEYDVNRQRSSIEKITKALNSCQTFHDTARVLIGNQDTNGAFDIKLELNDIPRAYRMTGANGDVHLLKIDPETELTNPKEYALSDLPSSIQYKILKTTHPGLLTVATEYISGIRNDKADWKSVVDAYVRPWKKATYEAMGISPFDVLADVSESRLVGKFVDTPMRHLVLIDGSEYAYAENPLHVEEYSAYRSERDSILNTYKMNVMRVCKETGVIPQRVIELMNIYTGKTGPVVLCSPEEAIKQIRMERLSDPLSGLIQKINRAIKLYNQDGGFLASLRKPKGDQDIRKIDVNENGNITRIDVDVLNLTVSKPYIMGVGHKRVEFDDISHLPLTLSFIDTLKAEVEKIRIRPEYKTYVLSRRLESLNFRKGDVMIDDEAQVYVTYFLPNSTYMVWINPYTNELGSNDLPEIQKDDRAMEMLNKLQDIFEEVFLS